MDDILKKINQLAKFEPKSTYEMALKLTEETGEVAQAALSINQASGLSYKNIPKDNLQEECMDVILVATTLYFKSSGASEDEMKKLLYSKIEKWEKHLEI